MLDFKIKEIISVPVPDVVINIDDHHNSNESSLNEVMTTNNIELNGSKQNGISEWLCLFWFFFLCGKESPEELIGVAVEFEKNIRFFKYLISGSGLHVRSSKWWIMFIRTTVWYFTFFFIFLFLFIYDREL